MSTDLERHYRFQRRRNRGVPAHRALEIARYRIESRNALAESQPDVAASYDDCGEKGTP